MKILKLSAENVKRISVVEIVPDPAGAVVTIAGPNDAGKTSVLDSIEWALRGGKSIQSVPVRKGQDKAKIQLLLGDGDKVEMVVERKFTAEGGDTLSLTNPEGLKYPTPQKMLDAIWNAISVDPLAFIREKPDVQFKILRGLVELDVDPVALDKANKADYEARTEANRDLQSARARTQGVAFPDDTPLLFVDETAIVTELANAGNVNAEADRAATQIETMRNKITLLLCETADMQADLPLRIAKIEKDRDDKIADLEDQIKEVRASATRELLVEKEDIGAACEKNAQDALALEGELTKIVVPERADVADITARLNSAKAVNAMVTLRRRREEYEADAKAAELKADTLTANMEGRDKEKSDAMGRAKLPVDGLGFAEDGVTFNGLPFNQASTAQQIRVSMAIAMAANPKLKVIRIKEASFLDAANLKLVAEMAADKGFQVWMEIVDDAAEVGIVMEDGHVKGKPPRVKETVEPGKLV